MFPGDHAIPPPPQPPSISSAPITTKNSNQHPQMDNSQTGIHTQFPATLTDDIIGQIPSFQALAGKEGKSNDHNKDATGENKGGQPPFIENRHEISQTTAGGDYVGGGESSENGISAGEPEKYFDTSMTGKSIGKYKPPPYYLDDEKK